MKFNCEYYIGTGPCAPMCTNPLYETGSGIANAYCNTCRYRMERLEAENAKMRADLKDMAGLLIEFARGRDEIGDRLNVDDRTMPVVAAYLSELGIEVDE